MSSSTLRFTIAGLVVALIVGQFLIFSSIGLLLDTLTASGYERLTVQSVPYEMLASLLCIAFSALLLFRARYSSYYVILTSILLVFVLVNIANTISVGGNLSHIKLFLGIFGCHIAGGILARHNRLSFMTLTVWAAGTFLLLFGISAYHVLFDNVLYVQVAGVKPTFPGYIVSTELSNIAGLATIAIFFWRRATDLKAISNLMLAFSVALCIWFMASGTILALVAIVVLSAERITFFRSIYTLVGVCVVLILPFFVMLELGFFESIWLIRYLEDSVFLRLDVYAELLKTGIENPLAGIGLGEFYEPPHHNFLGLWAETGVLSVVAYATYSIMGLTLAYIKLQKLTADKQVQCLLAALFFAALFIFFKGMVHDTWHNKFFYFSIAYVLNKL